MKKITLLNPTFFFYLFFLINLSTYAQVGIGTTSPTAQLTVMEDGIFNESGNDHDFRIESEDNVNMFTLDGSNNTIGINNTSDANSMIYITPEDTTISGLKADLTVATTGNTDDGIVSHASHNAGFGAGWFTNSNRNNNDGTGYGTAGMGYGLLASNSGYGDYRTSIYGSTTFPASGVGSNVNANQRVAGVFGSVAQVSGTTLTNHAWGALGYNSSSNVRWAGYFINILAYGLHTDGAGRTTQDDDFTPQSMGIGVFGGYMSAAMKGKKYGLSTSGKDFGLYIDGSGYTNKHLTQLNKTSNGEIIPTFVSTSTTLDVTTKGKSNLSNGTTRITFEKNFINLDANEEDMIITLSPLGESNGLFITNVDKTGFTVKENSNGNSNVKFNWIAIASINRENTTVPQDLLNGKFESTLKLLLEDETTSDDKILNKNIEQKY